MRTDFDFSPYYRATVGFDRVFDLAQFGGQPDRRGRLSAVQYRKDW